MNITVSLKFIGDKGEVPVYATPGSAAVDLRARLDAPLVLAPGDRFAVPTGIAVGLPGPDVVGMIFARSGLGAKHGIGLPNGVGVIDSDYRGEILVALINQSDKPYTITPGDRIAQMAFLPVCRALFEVVSELSPTGRGGGGFGSTGQ